MCMVCLKHIIIKYFRNKLLFFSHSKPIEYDISVNGVTLQKVVSLRFLFVLMIRSYEKIALLTFQVNYLRVWQ